MIGWRVWLGAGVVLALAASVAWLRTDARQDLIDEIEGQNNEANSAADAADLDLIDCLGGGEMFWDYAAGVCRRAAADGG